MILTTAIYGLFETLIQLILEAIILMAEAILDPSVVNFSPDKSIIEQFCEIIPFATDIGLPSIIMGLAYGLVLICIFIGTLKSMTTAITGEESQNAGQVLIRGAATMILIMIVFGTNYGATGTINGLLYYIGKLFSTVMSFLNGVADGGFKLSPATLVSGLSNPLTRFADLVLVISIAIGVWGAVITYIERVVSFAITIMFGPIALALNTLQETADTAKQWALSVLTQFLAIFVSLTMWAAFLRQLNVAFSTGIDWGGKSIFRFAVAIALLGIMKNSEKILNSFGLRTVSMGDASRIASTGMAMMMLAGREAMHYRSHGGKTPKDPGKKDGTYDENGNINTMENVGEFSNKTLAPIADSVPGKTIRQGMNDFNRNLYGTGNLWGYVTSPDPKGYRMSHKNELEARRSLAKSTGNVSASSLNDSILKNSSITATGGASGMMNPVSYNSSTFQRDENGDVVFDDAGNAQYEQVNGWMGDVKYQTSYGETKMLEDAVVVKSGAKFDVKPGQFAGNYNGEERVFAEAHPIVEGRGAKVYATVPKKDYKYEEHTNNSGVKEQVSMDTNTPKEIERTVRHESHKHEI